MKNVNKGTSLSQSGGYKAGPLMYTSIPPFLVDFFMLRVNINSTFTTEVSKVPNGFLNRSLVF